MFDLSHYKIAPYRFIKRKFVLRYIINHRCCLQISLKKTMCVRWSISRVRKLPRQINQPCNIKFKNNWAKTNVEKADMFVDYPDTVFTKYPDSCNKQFAITQISSNESFISDVTTKFITPKEVFKIHSESSITKRSWII